MVKSDFGFEKINWLDLGCGTGILEEEAKEHNARCGVNYYPITVDKHREILKNAGFKHVHVF